MDCRVCIYFLIMVFYYINRFEVYRLFIGSGGMCNNLFLIVY